MVTTDSKATIIKGSTTVEILMSPEQPVKHNFDKQLTIISQPKSPTGQSPIIYLIDLKRLKEVITITGILEDETTEGMYIKKQNLRNLMQTAGTMTLQWDSNDPDQPYTVNIVKADITEATGGYEDTDETKSLSVVIQFAIGTHKG